MSESSDPWAAFRRPAAPATPAPVDEWAAFRRPQAARAQADTLPLPPPPAPPVPDRPAPATFGTSFSQGAGDLVHGGAQLAVNALPGGVVGAVNDATAWVNRQPIIGPVTRALGMVPATAQDVNATVTRREEDYQASRAAAGAQADDMDWGRLAGSYAGTLPVAAALPVGGTLLRSAAAGAATGGVMGAAAPVTDAEGDAYWGRVKENAETGFQLGAITGPIGHVVGRAVAPRLSQEARALMDEGVQLTPGQALGGVAKRVEDLATSVPGVGDVIQAGRARATDSFNRAAGNRVLEPLGERMAADAPVGREMIEALGGRVGQAYDDAIAQVRPFGPDQQFAQDIAGVSGNFLTPNARQQFQELVRDRVMSRFGNGTLDGATARIIDSDIGRMAAAFRASADVSERELGGAFGDLQASFRGLMARQNPQAAPQIDAANQAYGNLLRVQGAAGGAGAVEGVFSPAQLGSAVRQGDRTLRHRAYAQGNALMQDLSDAGRSVLPSSVPDSGTPSRMMMAGAALGGASLAGVVTNPLLLAAGTAAGAYTPAGTRAMNAFLRAPRSAGVDAAGDALTRSGVPLNALFVPPPSQPEMRR